MMEKLTEKEIELACKYLRKILSTDAIGEFNIGNKAFIEVYNEPRRE